MFVGVTHSKHSVRTSNTDLQAIIQNINEFLTGQSKIILTNTIQLLSQYFRSIY